MNKLILGSLSGILLLSGLALFFTHESDSLILNQSSNQTRTDTSETEIIPDVPLAEKVGQLFMIGHWSSIPTDQTTALISEYHIGGIIIMDVPGDGGIARNWTSVWQSTAKNPLLIGIDQEGGLVSRLKDAEYIQTAQPEITNTTEAYNIANERGKALRALGINHNYAPVLDRSVLPESFMYDRVFRDPTQIASLADAMIRGYQNNSVIAAPKHYPGHPDTSDDSHITLPVLNLSSEEYIDHTRQFTDLLKTNNTKILMTAHVLVPELDSTYPTTVSKILIDDLRNRTEYNGILITDDIAMQAISDTWTHEEAAVLALQAGVDIVMIAAKPENTASTINAVLAAVESGELSQDRIDEAYSRVMSLKAELDTEL